MKIKEIIKESPTDLVARFYIEADKDQDKAFNLVANVMAERNAEYYRKYFKEFFENGEVPVFETPVDKPQPEFTNKPEKGVLQSAGYRGLQRVEARVGLPHDKIQRYDPSMYKGDGGGAIPTN